MVNVLIVDDDDGMRDAVAAVLRLNGHEIAGQATNGAEALALLKDGCRPAVILLDLNMPVMNGWQFVEALRDTDAAAPPIVVFSSHTNGVPSTPPVVAVLRKPSFDTNDLLSAIRSAAASSR